MVRVLDGSDHGLGAPDLLGESIDVDATEIVHRDERHLDPAACQRTRRTEDYRMLDRTRDDATPGFGSRHPEQCERDRLGAA